MLRRAVTALARSTDVTGIIVVGGLLTLSTWIAFPLWVAATIAAPPVAVAGPIVVTPALVVRGYFIRILADGMETGNADGAASFVAWNELYCDGVKSVLVSAVLLAPLLALLATATGTGVALRSGTVDPEPIAAPIESALGPDGTTAIVAAGVGLLTVVTVTYLLAYAYVKPAALAAFAASGRLRDGLRPSRVVRVAGSGRYAVAWVVAAATLVVGYALAGPLVLIAVGGVVVFVVRTVAYGVYGRGARAALSEGAPAKPARETAAPGDTPASVSPREPAPRSVPAAAGHRRQGVRSMGDGGSRSARTEASPAVQSGRTVPIDRRRSPDAASETRAANAGRGGERRTTDVDRRLPSDDRRVNDGSDPDGSAGFAWVSEETMTDGKDKS
ncbi:DUF4013 domain-containing protein [Halorubrum laminariae]|uniref:DUF4013 domain-containing protein n=1 Tax=Halorubrum laminariae TaxID=1433523 RepID=A0ABD6BX99_9EURY|nr:DUF4013 domain-containing protein [Halorubrum laminariae]